MATPTAPLVCGGCGRPVIVVEDGGVWETFRACSCDAPIVGNMTATVTAVGGFRAKQETAKT